MTLNEAVCALYPGKTYTEALYSWALANGAAGGTVDEALHQVAVDQSYTSFSALLIGLGYTGTLNEMMYDFFANDGGTLVSGTETEYPITVGSDDGREIIGTLWSGAPAAGCTAYNDSAIAYSAPAQVATLSFPSIVAAAPVIAARLELEVIGQISPGTWVVQGLGTATAASNFAWNNTAYPASTPSGLVAQLTTAVSDPESTVAGTYLVDVTDIVNEIIGGANWATGHRMNFVIKCVEATAGASFGYFAGSGAVAKLVLTQ